jgi:hypothetical protein
MALAVLALSLAACGGAATPELIGSYPRDSDSGYAIPEPSHPAANLLVVYDTYLEMEVGDVAWAADQAAEVAYDHGGYVAGSETWFHDGQRYATLTLAVPVSRFDAARSAVLGLGTLVSESTSGDLQDPPYDHEDWNNYSHITAQFRPGPGAFAWPDAPSTGWNPLRTFTRAFAVVSVIFQAIADVLIWVFVLAGPFVLIGLAVRAVLRRQRPPTPGTKTCPVSCTRQDPYQYLERRTPMDAKRTYIVISTFALALAACAGPATTPAPDIVEMAEPTQAPAATEVAAALEAPAMLVPTGTALPTQAAAIGGGQLAFAPSGSSMVIKDAEIELLVDDTDRAIVQVTQMAADYNGYIISSQTWFDYGYRYASLRLGIPSIHFEKALNHLRGLGLQVLRENASGQDVGAEYVDLQSRLTNLEATAARVREFLADAKTVEESLRISAQLSDLEAQIEQVKGQMRYYEGRAAVSTVTIYLTPEFPTPTPTVTPTATATMTPTPPWNPGETFDEASGVLGGLGRSTADGLIWLLVVGGPPALAVVVLAFLLRRLLPKSPAGDLPAPRERGEERG